MKKNRESTWFSVDIESDGPCPGLYSMISFGAVAIQDTDLSVSFYGQCKPISEKWIPEALAVSGHTREDCEGFQDPSEVIPSFVDWVQNQSKGGRAMFVSDNNGFDWQFINYYCHRFAGTNPFGYSSTNLNSLYKGLKKDLRKNIRHLRKTKHTHHPVDDARGNAEAFQAVLSMMARPF